MNNIIHTDIEDLIREVCEQSEGYDDIYYYFYYRISAANQCSSYRGTVEMSPNCDCQSPPLFVFLPSPAGASLTCSSTSTSHVTHLMLINLGVSILKGILASKYIKTIFAR